MIDAQRGAVRDAMRAAAAGERPVEAAPLVVAALRRLGSSARVEEGRRFEASRRRVAAPRRALPTAALHAAAHAAVDPVFPPHGAEFCAALLRAADGLAPASARRLRAEFEARGVHFTPDHRRRAVMRSVLQRAGDGTADVEAIADDPPQRVVGPFLEYRRGVDVVVGGADPIPLPRLRYFGRVS